ncbi:MAG: Holliday junction branch migration protein RuvA [Dehalococcoidia bacterium]
MSPIARLRGVVQERGPDWLVVSVGGVGFLVQAPVAVLGKGKLGEEIDLHTHLIAREDGIALYGFASADERRLFQMLIGVSGVGPRVALGLLSAMGPDELSYAIASGNAGALAKAPGVGQKLAGRIVLELRGKLVAEAPTALPTDEAQVVEALMGLGYTQAEAMEAVSKAELPSEASVEDKVRLALQSLAGR